MSAKAIIITSANDHYFGFVQDLILSIHTQTFEVSFDVGLLDTGLTAGQRDLFEKMGVKVEAATRNYAQINNAEKLEKEIKGFRTLTEQLFMREYFPGYDVYLWMDADSWVQTPEAINFMIPAAAASPALFIAPELDRSYQAFFESAATYGLYHNWYLQSYGEAIAGEMALRPMYNVGIWAMHKNCPAWQRWADIYLGQLRAIPNPTADNFMAHQLGMNIALHRSEVPCQRLPARYNWLTALGMPLYDKEKGLFLEPSPPYQPISNFHLTRDVKGQNETLLCTDGSTHVCSLMYRAKGRTFEQVVADEEQK